MSFTPPQLLDLLSKVKHFRSMRPEDRLDIISSGHINYYPRDSVIFAEGESCAGMYVLLKGQVQLQKLGPDGKKQILAFIDPVIMFNEVPVLDGGTNVATAIASKTTVTWCIACTAFHRLLGKYPQMGIGLLKILAARNRLLMSQYEDLSFRSVIARTAKLLLDLSGAKLDNINRQIHPNLQLAALVASGPESFSRSLSLLRKNGYIQCTREFISILQEDALAELASINIS